MCVVRNCWLRSKELRFPGEDRAPRAASSAGPTSEKLLPSQKSRRVLSSWGFSSGPGGPRGLLPWGHPACFAPPETDSHPVCPHSVLPPVHALRGESEFQPPAFGED